MGGQFRSSSSFYPGKSAIHGGDCQFQCLSATTAINGGPPPFRHINTCGFNTIFWFDTIFRIVIWLVVWNIFIFPYIGHNHPKWLIFFRGVAKPPTSYGLTPSSELSWYFWDGSYHINTCGFPYVFEGNEYPVSHTADSEQMISRFLAPRPRAINGRCLCVSLKRCYKMCPGWWDFVLWRWNQMFFFWFF